MSKVAGSTRPPLMGHDARQRLIRAPLSFRTCSAKSWGGTSVNPNICWVKDSVRAQATRSDESYLRYGVADDPNMGEV